MNYLLLTSPLILVNVYDNQEATAYNGLKNFYDYSIYYGG